MANGFPKERAKLLVTFFLKVFEHTASLFKENMYLFIYLFSCQIWTVSVRFLGHKRGKTTTHRKVAKKQKILRLPAAVLNVCCFECTVNIIYENEISFFILSILYIHNENIF